MLVGREQLLLWPTTELQAGQGGGWNSWQHECRHIEQRQQQALTWKGWIRRAGCGPGHSGTLAGCSCGWGCWVESVPWSRVRCGMQGEGTSSERPQNNQGLCAAALTRASRTAIITCTPRPHLTVRKRLVS